MYFAVPEGGGNLNKNEKRKLKKLYNMKFTVVPVVIETLGTVPKLE